LNRTASVAGFTIGAAGGLASLEAGIIGWLVMVAFLAGAARARQLATAGGALLIGLALTWGSLLLSNGTVPVIVGWLITGLAALVVGWLGVACSDSDREG
jgi:hypothetical protein